MIGSGPGIDVRVKVQDIVSNQLPEFILSEAPLTDDFLKQFYISQEFQGGPVDFATNLDQYLSLETLTTEAVAGQFELTQSLDKTDTVVHVNTTKSFPNHWGLLKIGDEIITYTGVTTNTFTGAVRGFSGITSYRDPADPQEIIFEETSAATHPRGSKVQNLSTLFLKEFYNKIKYTFTPGFENLEFDSDISVGTWIRQARSFYQSKGSEESFRILFKVLFGEDPTIIDLENFLIKPSQAEFSRRDYAVAVPVIGNPITLKGKTVFQSDSKDVFGAVSEIETFTRDNKLYYRIYFFVSNEEIENERKLFTIPGRTRAHRPWKTGDTTVTVDTTIGFRNNNQFITSDGTLFTYEDRTVNQFLGVKCINPTKTIDTNDTIIDDITISGVNDAGETVVLRITGSLSDISFDEDGVPFTSINEKIQVDALGENILPSQGTRKDLSYSQIVANSFIYNTSVRFEVIEINGSTFQVASSYLDKSYIAVNDTVDFLQRGSQVSYATNRLVTNVDYLNSTITIDDSFGIPENIAIDIRRNQKYASSTGTSIDYGDDAVLSNILNLYDGTQYDGNYYVATNSLPSYEIDVDIIESIATGITTENFEDFNSFTGEFSTFVFEEDTEFITGDLIRYITIGEEVEPICALGEYFVEVLPDPRRVRLYLSPSFIGSANFVGLIANEQPGAHVFTLLTQSQRQINSRKVYQKIPVTNNLQNVTINRTPAPTNPGVIALLTNGVEVISYKSEDEIYLGPLVEVDPVSAGEGYSVVSPPDITLSDPNLQLTDTTGIPSDFGPAKVTPVIKGRLEKILIDPQDFDIDKVFSITVVGGNSSGATALPTIERKRRDIPFDTRLTKFGGGVDPDNESILFLVEHKLPKGEPITYDNKGLPSIGVAAAGGGNVSQGQVLANGGIYYAEPINNKTIKIYPSIDDLNAGINTVGFTSNFTGFGVQSFNTLSRNRLTGATIIEDGGDFYYRKMKFNPDNVYVEYDELRYDNHGFATGDLVEYGTTEVSVGGLSTTNQYYVTSVDDNTIKLSDAGIGGTSRFDFDRKDYVDLTSVGVGTHHIKYPDVSVEVIVSYASTVTGVVTATPFIRGGIEQVYIDDGGYYGSDIINFQKNPNVTIQKGRGARLKPLVINGQVVGVQILNKGVDYPDNPDINVVNKNEDIEGQGASIRAIVVDGEIEDVIILASGIGYSDVDTDIEVVDPAKDAILTPRIRPLVVNFYSRFGYQGLVDNNYSVCAYDRTVREGVYEDVGNTHSPIIGWANDGNPIYGGFGLDEAENFNSGFRAMRTSYRLNPSRIYGRPPITVFPPGFFIDDYEFRGDGDLDIHNGRYCRTPEFPNGVYAYFAGISTDTQSLERVPQFPYFVGESFRDGSTITNSVVDQEFEVNDKPIFRNTQPYAIGQPFVGSEFLDQSYLFDVQGAIIQSVNTGTVDSVTIVGAGASYSVGDVAIFDNSEDNLSVVVQEVEGTEIISIGSEILEYTKDVTKVVKTKTDTVRVYVEPLHEYNTNDSVIFSGLSTFTSALAGQKLVSVDNTYMTLYAPVPSTPIETVTDVFVNSITPNVSVGSSVRIGIGSTAENAEVINIFPTNKALRVRRRTGYGFTNPIGADVRVYPNYFEVRTKIDDFQSELDEQYYFNPRQTFGVGVETGSSVAVDFNIGNITKTLSIPAQQIYAPNHGFRTNELITFEKNNTDSPVNVFDGSSVYNLPSAGLNTSNAYVVSLSKDYIGLRTDPNGPNLFLASNGSDSPLYSIKTNRFAETVQVDRIQAVVTTKEEHRLRNKDKIAMRVTSNRKSGVGTNPTVVVEFDEISESLIVDPEFTEPSGITTESNLIRIQDHGFVTGDYLLYQNYGTAVGGLTTHRKYFVILFDRDRFKLAETFADVRPGNELPINLTSVGIGSHKFSKVNPSLKITRDNDITFDIGSPSLFGRSLEFFYDQTLTEAFETNGVDDVWVVSGFSTEGYAGARKFLDFSENNPDVLYYGVSKGGYISTADPNSDNYSSIVYTDSSYAIEARVDVTGITTFKYSLLEIPERDGYGLLSDELFYTTSSKTALGGVGRVTIVSTGSNFNQIPEFVNIISEFGSNATLRAESSDIGKLSSFRIQNPGWGYSADNTLRPKGIIQPTIEFSDSDFITGIDILDGGNGYQQPPNPVLIDAVTREEIDNGSIALEVQSSTISDVIIDVAPSGLSKNIHELWTINNNNGIPILTIDTVDNNVGVVTYTIQTPILGYKNPPFAIGDQVFVENIIPEIGQESYMNSAEYGYKFFEVVTVTTTNPIEVGIQYPPEAIGNIGVGQTFQNAFSSIVNSKLYPRFKVNQATAIFIVGERLSIFDEQGDANETDLVVEESTTAFFKVRGNFDLLVGDVLKGNNSGVIVTITDITDETCRFQVNSISRVDTGWEDQVGFLNEEFQALPDNDYYQNLSYSIKSQVLFEELISPVNRLVHPSGLKNFADTKLESNASIGVGVTETETTITLDFIGLTDVAETPLRVDRINSFDLGQDAEVNDNRSNAIRFQSRTANKRLTDFIEVRTNRVLLHDDISNDFIDDDNARGQEPFTEFNVITGEYTRGLLQARNPFTDQVQFTELISLTVDNNAFNLQKAVISDNEEGYGDFDGFSLPSTEYQFRFTPFPENVETFDLDFKLLTHKFVFGDEAEQDIGYVELDGENVSIGASTSAEIYTAQNSANDAAVIHAVITDANSIPHYFEFYAVVVGNDTYSATYDMSGEPFKGFSGGFNGEFNASIRGNKLVISFTNLTTGNILFTSKSIEYRTTTKGENPYRFQRRGLADGQERSILLASDVATGISTAPVALWSYDAELFQSIKTVVYIKGSSNVGAIHQVMTVNSAGKTYVNSYPFLTQGKDLDPQAGIGSFGARLNGTDMELVFYPDAGITPPQNLTFTSYNEIFYRELDEINYRNRPLDYSESEENYFLERYIAPLGERTNNVRFPLTYKTIPIYEKVFEPNEDISETGVGNLNLFTINEHFFSTGEELYYEPGSSVQGVPFASIDILPVADWQGIVTSTLPPKVFCIKRDLNRFQLAPTLQAALNNQPFVITGIGTGNAHRLGMEKKLEKTIITIDGVIQSPIVPALRQYELDEDITFDEELITMVGIATLSVGDLLLANEEFLLIKNVGFGTTSAGPINNSGSVPLLSVERGVIGSGSTDHIRGTTMELYRGSYNIVESDVVFTEAPSGRGQIAVNESNIVEFNSTFQGRTFLQREYDQIALFDDISDQFDGQTNNFNLTSMGSTVAEIENGSGVLIINDIYQTPTTDNNSGNNYFYSYNPVAGINSVVFTGITSSNGERVVSEFDINQNQIPRGGLIVSLGSTPGLGYAPLYGAKIQPIVVGGVVTGIITENQVGVTTSVIYANYNNNTGDMVISGVGSPVTNQITITDADYREMTGSLIVTSATSLLSLGIDEGDILYLRDLEFSCTSGAGTTTIFPDKDPLYTVVSLVDEFRFSVNAGVSTLAHDYVSGGTFQKFNPFRFGREELNPDFVYLNNLEFSCDNSPFITTSLFPDETNYAPFVFRDDLAHWRVNVGVASFTHDYVGGGTFGQMTINSVGSGYRDRVSIAVTDPNHSGNVAEIIGTPTDGGELQFTVIDGGTGYTDGTTDTFAPDPNYFNLEVEGVFRRSVGFTTVTGKNLRVTLDVGAATTVATGRSEYFEVKNYDITNQGYSFEPGDIIKAVGLVTAKGLSQPLEDFTLTVLDVFSDNFSAWNFGETDYIDSIKPLQDGTRTRFPLVYKGETFSFEQNPADEDSAAIDLSSILLIYVNTVLQIPDLNYTFDGGNTFEFSRAPFPEDDIDIYFYRGKRNLDSRLVTEVDESIRPGDELQMRKNNAINKNNPNDPTKTQNIRTVTEIASSDTVRTNIYFGDKDLEQVRLREVAWDKQKRDIFIYGEVASKARDSLEPIIFPNGAIIRSLSPADTEMFVSSSELFEYEENVPGSPIVLTGIQGKVFRPSSYRYNPPVEFEPAELEAVVNSNGEVSTINIINPGAGYPSDTEIRIGVSTGTRAEVGTLIFNPVDGSIITILVGEKGSGYDQANPPTILIKEPTFDTELISAIPIVQGFAGIITGIQATSGSSGASKGIRFFYRVNPDVIGSELQTNYSVVVNQTVVGNGVVSIGPNAATTVGVGTEYLDAVYEVRSNVVLGFTGYFDTNVSSGTNLSGINTSGEILGYFSWGRLANLERDVDDALTYNIDGLTYTHDMDNYPTIKRITEGLRNEGGLAKQV